MYKLRGVRDRLSNRSARLVERQHTNKKAIYKPFPQAVPDRYTIDAEHCVNCGKCTTVCKSDAIELEANLLLGK